MSDLNCTLSHDIPSLATYRHLRMPECLATGFHDAEDRTGLCMPCHEVPLGTRVL